MAPAGMVVDQQSAGVGVLCGSVALVAWSAAGDRVAVACTAVWSNGRCAMWATTGFVAGSLLATDLRCACVLAELAGLATMTSANSVVTTNKISSGRDLTALDRLKIRWLIGRCVIRFPLCLPNKLCGASIAWRIRTFKTKQLHYSVNFLKNRSYFTHRLPKLVGNSGATTKARRTQRNLGPVTFLRQDGSVL